MDSEPVQANPTKDMSKRIKAGFLLFGIGFLIAAATQMPFIMSIVNGNDFWTYCFFSGSVLSFCLLMIACFRSIQSRWRFVFLLLSLIPVCHVVLMFFLRTLTLNPNSTSFLLNSMRPNQCLFFWVILFILWIFKALAPQLKLSQIAFELWIFLLLGDLAFVSKETEYFPHLGNLFDNRLWIVIHHCLAVAALIIAAIAAFKMRKFKKE